MLLHFGKYKCVHTGHGNLEINDKWEIQFSQRKINECNKLSTDCVSARSLNIFKNKVDTYPRGG